MAIETAITRLFGIEHPVLLAPMGMVSGGALAAAVTNAGGLGLLGAGYGNADWLGEQFQAAGNARVGVGFITWSLAQQPALLDLALERSPAAVMLSFGDPVPFLDKIKRAGAIAICQVQSVAQAREAAAAGADLIVAQGGEAGGHGATRGTLALVPAVVDAVAPLPVAAAGGIADGRGLAAALMLGAEGVLIGTRFYAAEEALGWPAAKQRIAEAAGDDTLRTTIFDIARGYDWPDQYTGRAIVNRFARDWHGREQALVGAAEAERARYAEAAAKGDVETIVVFAGEAVDLIDAVRPAAEIVARLVGEAEALLAGAAARLG